MLPIRSATGVRGFIFKSFHAIRPKSITKSLTYSMLSPSNTFDQMFCIEWSNDNIFRPCFEIMKEFASIQPLQFHGMPCLLYDMQRSKS